MTKHLPVIEHAKRAIEREGLSVFMQSINGGTGDSRLSFMGLPCANLFTGMPGIYSPTEWIAVSDMEKAVLVLVNLGQIWEAG